MADAPTNAQRKVAQILGYDPGRPDTWDFDIVERLERMRHCVGEERFFREILRMKGHTV